MTAPNNKPSAEMRPPASPVPPTIAPAKLVISPCPLESAVPTSRARQNDGPSRWTIGLGMSGRHPSEWVDGMDRNQQCENQDPDWGRSG